ncbi:MAG: ATP-binding cassette domain-containing protein [Proteobacteria bacterium]|nr:ATP-binding cassette domain-containing protein [Pseudomonadota bacterium]
MLLTCQSVSKSLGDRTLFEGVSFTLHPRDKVGLIGPNGVGKSTLLKILAGMEHADDGQVEVRKGTKLVYLAQAESFNDADTVLEAALKLLADEPLDEAAKLAAAQVWLGRIGFADMGQRVQTLSGGWRKRLAIAAQLAREPDILLLDEPTNHLDMDGIWWLEDTLKSASFAFVVISHDRAFLNSVTTRTMEINDCFEGSLYAQDVPYTAFMEQRDGYLETQQIRRDNLANKVRREVEWLKAGVKARTTKQTARIKETLRLQEELSGLKSRTKEAKKVEIEFEDTERKTKRLVVLHNVEKSFDDKCLFKGLDLTLKPGMRLGLLGRNGSGKSSLLRLIGAMDAPTMGTVTLARGVRIATFDQNRQLLDPEQTLRQALAPSGGDAVIYRDELIHVASWAKRLRFRSDQLQAAVKRLSGGEQARILIGRLMLESADVLLLDEPTNDLDIPSIEVLEDALVTFPGAVVLVTHDREMLDRVSTVLLALDGKGTATAYADLAQWQADQKATLAPKKEIKKDVNKEEQQTEVKKEKVKLTYKLQREFDLMEQTILEAETELETLQNNPVDATAGQAFTDYCAALGAAQERVDTLYARWAELEAMQQGMSA